jgi:hypothetical protein
LTIAVLFLVLHSLWAYVEARRWERAARSITTSAPTRRNPYHSRLDDAARFYEAAWTLHPGLQPPRGVLVETTPRARDIEWLRAMEPSLEMLDRGAALPACRFLWSDELPQLRAIRDVATAGSVRTRERLRSGDSAGAMASIHSAVRHLRVFTAEAPLIGQLFRMVMLEMAMADTKRFLEDTAPGPERAKLQELISAQDMPDAIEAAFTAERAWVLRQVRRYRLNGGGSPYGDHWILRPVEQHIAITMADFMSQAIDASRAPWPDRLRRLAEMPRPWGPAGTAVPSLVRAARTMARSAAFTHAMAACLRVEQHRQSHGGVPPETLADTGLDPFTGQPLNYRREESSYVVYSVGEDGKDDGGAVADGQALSKDIGYRIRMRR